jgi:hypothetical protein
MRRDALLAWMEAAPLMRAIHQRFMAEQSMDEILSQTLRALAGVRALEVDGDMVLNLD